MEHYDSWKTGSPVLSAGPRVRMAFDEADGRLRGRARWIVSIGNLSYRGLWRQQAEAMVVAACEALGGPRPPFGPDPVR